MPRRPTTSDVDAPPLSSSEPSLAFFPLLDGVASDSSRSLRQLWIERKKRWMWDSRSHLREEALDALSRERERRKGNEKRLGVSHTTRISDDGRLRRRKNF